MQLKVHRVRFVDCKPQAIHCLAIEDGATLPRLAVSRADSSIEIWSIKDWHQIQIIPGCKGSSVESLVWCNNRLFSAGLHGEITEWDLTRLAPKVSLDSFGGAVWSLAVNHSKTTLAAGCEDGSTRLFDITEDGLQFNKALDNQEGRILSLSWHAGDDFLVTGSSDSTVKLYSIATGRCVLRLTMEEFQKKSTLIWSVLITSDFTIVTGDSLGNTQFWDGKQGTLLQSYTAHKADVLSLCINEKENTVFSSGVDSKVVQFRLTPKENQGRQWMKSSVTRQHSHDVRALALLDSKDLLVSGGLDTKIGVYSLSKFATQEGKLILPFPHTPRVHLASKTKIIMHQLQSSLEFWRLGESVSDSTMVTKAQVRLLQLNAKGDNHILCCAVSPCATWVAFSTVHHIRIFHINLDSETDANISVKRVFPLPLNILPAQNLVFTQDSSQLVTTTSEHSMQVVELGDEPTLVTTLYLPDELQGISSMRHLSVSEDGRWAACVNIKNSVNVFDLQLEKHHCRLPSYSAAVTAIAFQPKTNHLALVCADRQVYMYNPESTKLTDWSRAAADNGLPSQWVKEGNKVLGITFSPDCHERMVLYSQQRFTVIDLRESLPPTDAVLFEEKSKGERRKRSQSFDSEKQGGETEYKAIKYHKSKTVGYPANKGDMGEDKESMKHSYAGFKICDKYQPLLFVGFNADSSMIAVERPWVYVTESLPPTLYRKRYGR